MHHLDTGVLEIRVEIVKNMEWTLDKASRGSSIFNSRSRETINEIKKYTTIDKFIDFT